MQADILEVVIYSKYHNLVNGFRDEFSESLENMREPYVCQLLSRNEVGDWLTNFKFTINNETITSFRYYVRLYNVNTLTIDRIHEEEEEYDSR